MFKKGLREICVLENSIEKYVHIASGSKTTKGQKEEPTTFADSSDNMNYILYILRIEVTRLLPGTFS